jgi:hypothetical protein
MKALVYDKAHVVEDFRLRLALRFGDLLRRVTAAKRVVEALRDEALAGIRGPRNDVQATRPLRGWQGSHDASTRRR